MTTRDARFRRRQRLRLPAEFQRCFADGVRAGGRYFRVHWLAGETVRLGLAVSRKVDPHAVGRNRLKRVAREWFRVRAAQLAGGDLVLVALRAAAEAPCDALRQELDRLLLRLGALPPTQPAGTMRDASPPPPAPRDD